MSALLPSSDKFDSAYKWFLGALAALVIPLTTDLWWWAECALMAVFVASLAGAAWFLFRGFQSLFQENSRKNARVRVTAPWEVNKRPRPPKV